MLDRTSHRLHGEHQVQVHRVARAQLRLLLVLGAKDVADAVQELEVVLLRVGGQARGWMHKPCQVQSKDHVYKSPIQNTYAEIKENVMAPVMPNPCSCVSADVCVSLHLSRKKEWSTKGWSISKRFSRDRVSVAQGSPTR